MGITLIVPLAVQLLSLSLKVAGIIEKSNEVDEKDKESLRSLIKSAKDGVTYIDENTEEGS